MNAVLALENGTWYCGTAAGATGVARGEVVFNTSMTGYQEVLTDPSYAGQLVTLTYPLVGNYGINREDFESRRIQGYEVTVLHAIYHVVEHLAEHTGQIIWATKGLTGEDLGFYAYLEDQDQHTSRQP